jgi:hypothetical protein
MSDDDEIHLPPEIARRLGDSEAAFKELRAAVSRAAELIDAAMIKYAKSEAERGGNVSEVTAALATGIGTALATVVFTCVTTSHEDREELFDHLVELIHMEGSATLELLDKVRASGRTGDRH